MSPSTLHQALKSSEEKMTTPSIAERAAQGEPVGYRFRFRMKNGEITAWHNVDTLRETMHPDGSERNEVEKQYLYAAPSIAADRVRDAAMNDAIKCCALVLALTNHQSIESYRTANAISRLIDDLKSAPAVKPVESTRKDMRTCYMCGHPAHEHPIVPHRKGGTCYGPCPAASSQQGPDQ